MPSLLKRRLAICAGVFVAVWASLALTFFQQPRFFSSPTANRETVEGDRGATYRTWREYDQAEISSDGNGRARIGYTQVADDFFTISQLPGSMTGKASNVQKLNVVREDGDVRLLAVAARWNTGEPEIDQKPMDGEFREPKSHKVFDWEATEAPVEWRAMPPTAPNTVRLRFLLEARGELSHFFPGNAAVFDARTRFLVGAQESVQVKGQFAALDLSATLWHDTPIQLVLDLPRGEPLLQDLPQGSGQSTWFQGPRAPVFKVLARGSGQIVETYLPAEIIHPFQSRALKLIPGAGSYILFNTPHTESGEFFQIRLREGESHWFQSATFRHCQIQTSQSLEDAKVAFYPERGRLWFDIPGMPMMPNRRGQVRNLFEVKIPFVDASQPDATAKLVGAAQMQLTFELSLGRLIEIPLRPQQQFHNLTPDAYLKLLSPTRVTMKDDTVILLGAPPDSLMDRVKNWWAETF